jgi:hypothetical protein
VRVRLRKRWLRELLHTSARLRATRTIDKRSPRMVKRRNSVYAAHNRHVPIRVSTDRTPLRSPPQPISPTQWFPAHNVI